MVRSLVIAVLAGAAMAAGLMWAFHVRPWHQPTGDEVMNSLTPTQKKAYQEGFDLCYQRVMANAPAPFRRLHGGTRHAVQDDVGALGEQVALGNAPAAARSSLSGPPMAPGPPNTNMPT